MHNDNNKDFFIFNKYTEIKNKPRKIIASYLMCKTIIGYL